MTKKADKLLEQMRRSQANWTYQDLERLYQGFGFEIKHGSNHDKIKHPKYRQLYQTLLRSKKIPKAYIKDAIELIDKLKELEEQDKSEGKEK